MKESFGTITKQFTLAPVRNRNLSYVFSGPTNILGFYNLSNISLNYFLSETQNFRPLLSVLAGKKVALFSPHRRGSYL